MLEMTRRQSSSVICSKGASMRTAALFTSASIRPKRRTVSSTIAATARGSVASAMCSAALPPACSIMATVSSACAREVLAFTMTAAPPAASERAIARPMLRAPPVTSATFPASSLPALIPTLDMRLLVTDRRQPGGDRWKDDDQDNQEQHAADEGHAGEINIAHRGARWRDALHDEEQQAERRRRIADLERQQHDEAEPRQVEAEGLGEREEDRRGEQHHGELVHEAAEEEDHADHDPQHAHRRELEAERPVHQPARGAGEREHLGKSCRAEDDEERHNRDAQGTIERFEERLPGHLAVAGGKRDHRHRAERGGLGGGTPADDHDEHREDDDRHHRDDVDEDELELLPPRHHGHRRL